MSTVNLNDILKERPQRFSTLQKILQKSSMQKEWTCQLRSLLKNPLNNEFIVTDVTKKQMRIYCFNSSAATQLKFSTPLLLKQLSSLESFSQIEKLYINVGPEM